ncbi:hypothetical protein HYDPIDRAFT_28988 [Hydnomerulius pinastri MD-312]|uniref:DUF6533 domain-containing protein n=1 Tax=Hydnomerulius pinastri MD-312 TaxID=994086 RepID=A0A0C9W8Z0_9AGAM|nr:hypothetical protein HYDPIDRAFT_28988 [Hydnomerulius pinastri MD-312]
MSTIPEVAEYISVARVVQVTRIGQLAAYVVMFYDHILTFDQEVEHIWKSSWSLHTVVFVILRYGGSAATLLNVFGFLAQAHASNDVRLELFPGTTSTDALLAVVGLPKLLNVTDLATALMHNATPVVESSLCYKAGPAPSSCGIYNMRLYVLYNNSKKILFLTGGAYIAEIAVMSTILGIADPNIRIDSINEPAPGIFICADLIVPKVFDSFWLCPLIFESILCLLAIRIGIQRSKDHLKPALISGTRLVNAVLMGNVMYFVGVLLSCVVNAAMWQNLGSQWLEVAEGFPQAIEVIAGCRLILHIRGAASGGLYNTTITSTRVGAQLQHFPPEPGLDEA